MKKILLSGATLVSIVAPATVLACGTSNGNKNIISKSNLDENFTVNQIFVGNSLSEVVNEHSFSNDKVSGKMTYQLQTQHGTWEDKNGTDKIEENKTYRFFWTIEPKEGNYWSFEPNGNSDRSKKRGSKVHKGVSKKGQIINETLVNRLLNENFTIKTPIDGDPLEYNKVVNSGHSLSGMVDEIPSWEKFDKASDKWKPLDESKTNKAIVGEKYRVKLSFKPKADYQWHDMSSAPKESNNNNISNDGSVAYKLLNDLYTKIEPSFDGGSFVGYSFESSSSGDNDWMKPDSYVISYKVGQTEVDAENSSYILLDHSSLVDQPGNNSEINRRAVKFPSGLTSQDKFIKIKITWTRKQGSYFTFDKNDITKNTITKESIIVPIKSH